MLNPALVEIDISHELERAYGQELRAITNALDDLACILDPDNITLRAIERVFAHQERPGDWHIAQRYFEEFLRIRAGAVKALDDVNPELGRRMRPAGRLIA